MNHGNRIKREDIQSICTAKHVIELSENQCFYSTDKAYEIWIETPLLQRIKRYDAKNILWIILK